MDKIGIPKYDDLINAETMTSLKEEINRICIKYKQFASQTAINNRESNLFEQYTNQYKLDLETLSNIRGAALNIFDLCNTAMFNMDVRALDKHMYDDGLVVDPNNI